MFKMHLFKLQINTYEIPGDSFHRYYLWNSIAFFAFSMVGHMLANILLYIEGKTCNYVIPKNNNEIISDSKKVITKIFVYSFYR